MEEGKQSETNKSDNKCDNMQDYIVIEMGMPSFDDETFEDRHSRFSNNNNTNINITNKNNGRVKPIVDTEKTVFISPMDYLCDYSPYRHGPHYTYSKDNINDVDEMKKQSHYLLYPTKYKYTGPHLQKYKSDMYIGPQDVNCPSHSV